jgi:hypothetical protein
VPGKFAVDSPLEEDGFELLVPPARSRNVQPGPQPGLVAQQSVSNGKKSASCGLMECAPLAITLLSLSIRRRQIIGARRH